MVSFAVSEQTKDYLSRLEQFVKAHVVPAEAGLERGEELVRGRVGRDVLPALRAEARLAGVYLPQLTAEHGGLDIGLTTLALAAELCGPWALAPLAINCMAPDEGNMHLLQEFGSPEQQRTWLEPLAAGAVRSCFGMTEPDAGSDPRRMVSRADRLPDGRWRINAHKVFTSGAYGASVCLLMVVTDPDGPARRRQSIFLVPTDAPGFEIVRDLHTMGYNGLGGHPETRWVDVVVDPSSMLGAEGDGFAIAQSRLGAGRLGHAMRWIGIAQRCVDLAVQRARSRTTFGAALADRQTIQWWLADAATSLYSARLMVLHTCWLIEQGRPHRTEISMVKTFVAETLGTIVDRTLQIFGGWGYTDDYPIERWYRDARAARIFDGPSEVHRMLVARAVLGAHDGSGAATTVGRVAW